MATHSKICFFETKISKFVQRLPPPPPVSFPLSGSTLSSSPSRACSRRYRHYSVSTVCACHGQHTLLISKQGAQTHRHCASAHGGAGRPAQWRIMLGHGAAPVRRGRRAAPPAYSSAPSTPPPAPRCPTCPSPGRTCVALPWATGNQPSPEERDGSDVRWETGQGAVSTVEPHTAPISASVTAGPSVSFAATERRACLPGARRGRYSDSPRSRSSTCRPTSTCRASRETSRRTRILGWAPMSQKEEAEASQAGLHSEQNGQ